MSDDSERRVRKAPTPTGGGVKNPDPAANPLVSPNPGPVAFETVALSTRQGPRAPDYVVIRDVNAYARFFSGDPPLTPVVNWKKEMVLGAALGTQPKGASVEIRSVRFEASSKPTKPGDAVVELELSEGDEGAPPIACPFHAVKLQRFDATFTFREQGKPKVEMASVLSIAGSTQGNSGSGIHRGAHGAHPVDKGVPDVPRIKKSLAPTEREGRAMRGRTKREGGKA